MRNYLGNPVFSPFTDVRRGIWDKEQERLTETFRRVTNEYPKKV